MDIWGGRAVIFTQYGASMFGRRENIPPKAIALVSTFVMRKWMKRLLRSLVIPAPCGSSLYRGH